jgi:hypothetical protein
MSDTNLIYGEGEVIIRTEEGYERGTGFVARDDLTEYEFTGPVYGDSAVMKSRFRGTVTMRLIHTAVKTIIALGAIAGLAIAQTDNSEVLRVEAGGTRAVQSLTARLPNGCREV